MQLGMCGLGRMGANIVRRLLRDGHECVVYNRTPDKVKQLESEGAQGTTSLDDFVNKLTEEAGGKGAFLQGECFLPPCRGAERELAIHANVFIRGSSPYPPIPLFKPLPFRHGVPPRSPLPAPLPLHD